MGEKVDLGRLVLEFEIARLQSVAVDSFCFVAGLLHLIDIVGRGYRLSDSVVGRNFVEVILSYVMSYLTTIGLYSDLRPIYPE